MASDSKLPASHGLSKEMQAYHQMIESRKPSDVSRIDTGTITLADLAARVDQLIQDLNKR